MYLCLNVVGSLPVDLLIYTKELFRHYKEPKAKEQEEFSVKDVSVVWVHSCH